MAGEVPQEDDIKTGEIKLNNGRPIPFNKKVLTNIDLVSTFFTLQGFKLLQNSI